MRTWTPDEVHALGVRTDLVTAGSVLGLSKNVAYQLAAAGTFPVPVLRLGARYVVPVAPLLRLLGLTPDSSAPALAGAGSATTDEPHGGPHDHDGTTAVQPLRSA